jgi:NADH dehydrogenase
METTKIAIIGGGYAGIKAAKVLLKAFKKNPSIEISLIDKNPYHTLMTELHEVAGGRVEPESVCIPFTKIFGKKPIRIMVDEIKTVNFESKILHGGEAQYSYDYLLIAPGAQPAYFGVPGAKEHGFSLWSHEDAVRLRRHIQDQFLKASKTTNKKSRQEALNFVVAGAGFTGVEMIGELLEWRYELCEEFQIPLDEPQFHLVEAMTDILPTVPKKLRVKAQAFLEKNGAQITLGSPITEVTPNSIRVAKGTTIPTNTLIWTCGVTGCDFAKDLNLSQGKSQAIDHKTNPFTHDETNQRFNIQKKGRIMVNDYMQALEYEEVYFLGDVVWYSEKQRTLPQIVETALQTAECAAHNIIGEIEKTEVKSFQSNYHGNMVSIGSRFAVADLMGVLLTGFLAMAFKHLVNLHYLFEIGGFSLCWDYLAHHFVHIPHDRSSVYGQARQKTPSYWLLPLRVILGFLILTSGLQKISQGDLDPANGVVLPLIYLEGEQVIASFQGKSLIQSDAGNYSETETGASEWGGSPSPETTAAASEWEEEPTADVVSSASEEWSTESEGSSMREEGDYFFEPLVYAGEFLRGELPEQNTQKKPALIPAVPPYEWFASWLKTIPWLAFMLQASVAIVEVLIGLAIMGGLFTWLASAAWIGLSLTFILSGWGYPVLIFHITASFAVMGGAGKVLGLDAVVIPWLRRWWAGTKLAQNTHLYMGRVPPPKTPVGK